MSISAIHLLGLYIAPFMHILILFWKYGIRIPIIVVKATKLCAVLHQDGKILRSRAEADVETLEKALHLATLCRVLSFNY